MTTLHASDTRIPPAAFNTVAFRGGRIRIHRRDGETVYLVSEADLKLLEAIEDALDADEAKRALDRHRAGGASGISLESLRRRLGK